MVDFSKLTDEEILSLVREGDKPKDPTPKVVSIKVGDEVIEGQTAEEVNKILAARLAEASKRPHVEPPAPAKETPQTPPSWDMKTFVEKFTTDPREGLKYYEMAQYGMPVSAAVPQLLAATMALAGKVQELEAASYAPKADEERKAVDEIIKSRGWQPSRQSYEDALMLAKASGRLKTQEAPRQAPEETFIPPRVRQTATTDSQNANLDEIARGAYDMPLDKLEAILMQAGKLNERRFTK